MNTLDSERIRAGEAKLLLENKLFNEAFDACELSILDQMNEVKVRDTDMHSALIMARQSLHAVKQYMLRMIETGEMAKLQLAEQNKPRAVRR